MTINLFGTDGIRGKVNLGVADEAAAIDRLISQREISPPIYRLIGEALGHSCEVAGNAIVVIGWDNRPANPILAQHLTIGLNIAGFEVHHIGVCATPGLHFATLSKGAEFGCMITASHNPIDDSGLKIFTKFGFKTLPKLETELSNNAISLSQEDREVDDIEQLKLAIPYSTEKAVDWSSINHSKWLNQRYQGLAKLIGTSLSAVKNFHQPLLIDSSQGSGKSWLAAWLTQQGLSATEISNSAPALNKNCGAGDLSPTQEWTFAEANASSHELIRRLPNCPAGTIVGAALDGDGDRCLLIESTSTGFQVIDGDEIADTLVNCLTNSGHECHLAASIESDLSLTTGLERFAMPVKVSETAVGDRWLAAKLSNNQFNDYLRDQSFPKLVGVEDSGHVVLASPHPKLTGCWSLVGDGAMTLVAYLMSTTKSQPAAKMQRGWKCRQSVSNVDRSKWDGKNQLSDLIERTFHATLSEVFTIDGWLRGGIPGESNLMLITCQISGFKLSLGVRNSGTQEKISVSARLALGSDISGVKSSVDAVCKILEEQMTTR